jgi:NADH-quinone oxidoreductase subunit N
VNPTFDWVAIGPELAVLATLVTVFVADLVWADRRLPFGLGVAGTLIALVWTTGLAVDHHTATMATDIYVVDRFSLVAKGLVLATTAAVLALGVHAKWKGEYVVMMLSSLTGMLVLASARDLLLFFVAFELVAIPGYLLVGWNKRGEHGHEGAVKYYLLGVVSAAVMLYGISLLYGLANATSFARVATALDGGAQDVALARIAVVFVIAGLVTKIAAVPFHFWTPDAYQAAPVPVAAFLSTASKFAGFTGLSVIVLAAVPHSSDVWAPLLWALAAVTMTAGNLLALRQSDAVRLLAYSSIAQAGYALVPLALVHEGAGVDRAVHVVFEFLIIYAVSNVAAFACLATMRSTAVDDLRAWAKQRPVLAAIFAGSLLSLAGIPPLGGWFAKLVIFDIGIDVRTPAAIGLVVVVALNSAIGLVYYAGLVRHMWLDRGDEAADSGEVTSHQGEHNGAPVNVVIVAGIVGALVVVSGVLPGLVTQLGGFAFLAK